MSAVPPEQLEANKRLVVEHHRRAATAPLPEPIFVIAEGDLVVQCLYQPQPEPADPSTLFTFFAFDAYRVVDGEIVEHRSGLTKAAPYVVPPIEATRDEASIPVGPAVPPEQSEANKRLAVDLFRMVLEAHNPDAAKDFVTEDYRQHAAHIQTGRAGLEQFVRQMFPGGPVPVAETLPAPPAIAVAEGDIVVIAGRLPQPEPEDPSRTWDYYVFDAFRVEDGLLAEHWSGVNKTALPIH